jgi:hypothetical protein
MTRWSDILGTSEGKFLDSDEKRGLAAAQTPFQVTGCARQEGLFGPQWVLSIEVEGSPRRLGLDTNPTRDRQFRQLEEALRDGERFPPVTLVIRQSASNLEYFDLMEASDDTDLNRYRA